MSLDYKELSPTELLDLLLKYTAKIAAESDLNKLLELMAQMGCDMLVADRCSLWLLSDDKSQLWTKIANKVDRITMPAGLGIVGNVVKNGKAYLTNDAYADKNFNPEIDVKTGYITKSILVVPLIGIDNQVIGAFQALNKHIEGGFREIDKERLNLSAIFSGKSLESSKMLNELKMSNLKSLIMLGEIEEYRSPETGEHIKRVAEYCKLLGQLYGLGAMQIDEIFNASPLHDFGKVAISDLILNKKGSLTEDEYEIMKTHAQKGYDFLINESKVHSTRVLNVAAEIALTHHERYNGQGYPNGLVGTNIPLYGRICSIADVFDALANARCYKKAWSQEAIVQAFENERGEQFDPILTDLLLDNIDDFFDINAAFSGNDEDNDDNEVDFNNLINCASKD